MDKLTIKVISNNFNKTNSKSLLLSSTFIWLQHSYVPIFLDIPKLARIWVAQTLLNSFLWLPVSTLSVIYARAGCSGIGRGTAGEKYIPIACYNMVQQGYFSACTHWLGEYTKWILVQVYHHQFSPKTTQFAPEGKMLGLFFKFRLAFYVYLSHPSLEWLHVFSSFPLPPLPQQLLPHTPNSWGNVLVDLSLTLTLCQGCGIDRHKFVVCMIKWELLVRSLQNMVAILYQSWLWPG